MRVIEAKLGELLRHVARVGEQHAAELARDRETEPERRLPQREAARRDAAGDVLGGLEQGVDLRVRPDLAEAVAAVGGRASAEEAAEGEELQVRREELGRVVERGLAPIVVREGPGARGIG